MTSIQTFFKSKKTSRVLNVKKLEFSLLLVNVLAFDILILK